MYFRKVVSIVLLVCAFSASLVFSASNELEYKPFPASWMETLNGFVQDGHIPGGVVIIETPEWGVRVGNVGKADLEVGNSPLPDYHFRVGSVSKMFTAMLILQLEQEGKLRLDDPVDMYLTGDLELKINADKIKIKNLLQMDSGLPGYLEHPTYQQTMNANPLTKWTPKQLLDFANSLTPFFNPGDTYPNPYEVMLFNTPTELATPVPNWWYVNTNYLVLGIIVETITGNPIHDEMKTRIFDRLDMDDTFFATDPSLPDPSMKGYTKMDAMFNGKPTLTDWNDVTAQDPSGAWAAGAIVSTPWDLLRFIKAIFTEDTLINDGTRRKWLNYVSADVHWMDVEYGVGGLMQSQRLYGDCRGHGGAIFGFKDLLYYFHDDDTYVVIALNTMDGGWEVTIMDEIVPMAIEYPVNYPTPVNQASSVSFAAENKLPLKWQAGSVYGDHYQVYVGTDFDLVDTANETTEGVLTATAPTTAFSVEGLQENTTYYWRVDTVSFTQGTVQGPVWTFQTGSYNSSDILSWELFSDN